MHISTLVYITSDKENELQLPRLSDQVISVFFGLDNGKRLDAEGSVECVWYFIDKEINFERNIAVKIEERLDIIILPSMIPICIGPECIKGHRFREKPVGLSKNIYWRQMWYYH